MQHGGTPNVAEGEFAERIAILLPSWYSRRQDDGMKNIFRFMYRSLFLVVVFIFFSVAVPCLCAGEGMSFGMTNSTCAESVASPDGYMSGAAGCMNIFDHAASWRALLSSSVPAAFFFFGVAMLSVIVSRFRSAFLFRLLEFRSSVLHPPEYFDGRLLLSSPLLRAFYTGILHAKIA